jgi:vancomycin resistance protein YoaR
MKRTKENNKRTVKFTVLAGLCVFGACLLGAGIWYFINASPAENAEGLMQKNVVIHKGISIADIDVGGLTYSEAERKLAETSAAGPDAINITVSDGSASFTLDSADIGAKIDSEAVLAAAISYGHSGTAFENAAAKSRLGSERLSIPLSFSFSKEGVESGLRTIAQDLYIAPVLPCAQIRLNEMQLQEFTYTDGSDGAELDVAATAEKILEKLQNGEYSFTADLVMKPVPPAWTLDFIKKNTKRISSWPTRYKTSTTDEITMNRVYNIQKAADIINTCVVMPGEEWSFNGYVGMRTLEAGWKEAPGISGGKEYTLQAGGGICQVSSTLYNALLCGNITVTDRQAHSIPSTYVPMGQDATVDSGGIDLKFRNDTAAPMYILAYTKPDPEDAEYMILTVSLYGEPLPEGVTYKPYSQMLETIENPESVTVEDPSIPAGWQVSVSRREGYVVETTLEKFLNGHFVETDYIHTDNYYGNPAEIRIGTGDSSLPVPEGATRVQ